MKKALTVILIGFMVTGFLITSSLFAQTPPPASNPTAQAPMKERGENPERHPEIHRALRKLRAAKEDLEKAAHDYAGHRVAAIQAIDQGIKELEAALQSDKK